METLETRQSVAQLKIFHDLIEKIKLVPKGILPVCQRCSDIKFKPLLGINQSYTFVFPQVIRLWKSLPKDITSIQDKINFIRKVESFLR